MFNRIVVQVALRRTLALDNNTGWISYNHIKDQDSVISLMIHDIFGAEILKTHKKKGWHFYNRINGERIDFAGQEMLKSSEDNHFEDIPSAPDEAYNYFQQEDYSTFFMRFIRAFEEAVGLDKY
ncbi:MAG: hypothetical protein ABSG89_04400 [Bacteroidales bacterium]|jgi:hypothetical protein